MSKVARALIWFVLPASVIVVCMMAWQGANQSSKSVGKSEVDFNYHIRPILSQNCFTCHGPDSSSREGDLRLDRLEDATALLRDGGRAIIPGDSRNSVLVSRIESDDPNHVMPPPAAKKTLTPRQIEQLRQWIDDGAEWKPHWAFIPPGKPKLPAGIRKKPLAKQIDFLINDALEKRDLRPVPSTSKPRFVRRVAYLLTGLPPSPADLEDFLTEDSKDFAKRVVDHYLASPHFGERWARHWMDLMRYADTMGHEFDFPISGSWHYRDYLIRAFNADVPYNQLVREHLAGDLLESPRRHPEENFNESVLGTGFFFLGEGKHSPVSTREEEMIRIDNAIDVISKSFVALTVSCARCHDHKFDNIPTTDFYAMYGMLESTRITPRPARDYEQHDKVLARVGRIKGQIEASLLPEAKRTDQASTSLIKQIAFNKEVSDTAFQLLGDFRSGDVGEWTFMDAAFKAYGVKEQLLIGRNSVEVPSLGLVSSRGLSPGVFGAFRSADFVVQHDSILVRAAGNTGTIRLIVNNFQVIRAPLYEGMEQVVTDSSWQEYRLDTHLVKGQKAYLEILPGRYFEHEYRLKSNDYIEIDIAVAYSNRGPRLQPRPEPTVYAKETLPASISGLVTSYDSLASALHDSTYFLGLDEGTPINSPVFIRGNPAMLSEEAIPHRFLTALSENFPNFPQNGSGRLAWADAVVDPANSLTSRVIVNRIWHLLFGRGIVETVDNFGLQGKLPTHPELLDLLAVTFVEQGWSIKELARQIALSETFRRSTVANESTVERDPDNDYLHHFPIRRLEGEAIRDGILAVSGRLDSTMFGKPVEIYLTPFMSGRGRPPVSGPLNGNGRRSIYMSIRRNFLPPFMLTFDMPVPFNTFGKRNTTTVPAQSLTLMNDPFVHQQAEYWANRSIASADSQALAARINQFYLSAFSRRATNPELEKDMSFIRSQAMAQGVPLEDIGRSASIWKDFCHILFNRKEFIYLL